MKYLVGVVLVMGGCTALPSQGSSPVRARPVAPVSVVAGSGEPRWVEVTQPGLAATEDTPASSDAITFELKPHRKNYIVMSYDTGLPGRAPSTLGGDNRPAEIKFQISIRESFFDSEDGRGRFAIAYTAKSFWQIFDKSAPFRTTDHEPELFYEWEPGDTFTQLRFGLHHHSNGEGGAASRSWNRVFAQSRWVDPDNFMWQRGSAFVLKPREEREGVAWETALRAWGKFAVDEDNNDDISEYYGYFELTGDLYWNGPSEPHLGVLLRNNGRRSGENRGALELNYSYTVYEGLRMLVHYFNGYGESLIDYRDSANRIGVGIELSR